MAEHFRVTNPNVMSEEIEGEVIIINLATGTYYSLRDVAADVWNLVQEGSTAGHISLSLQSRYEGQPAVILNGVRGLLAELVSEELVAVTNDQDSASRTHAVHVEENGSDRVPFRAPLLEKHTDMQELILLDPVHEVGAAGWPHRPTEDAA
jgi:hypothetical protein